MYEEEEEDDDEGAEAEGWDGGGVGRVSTLAWPAVHVGLSRKGAEAKLWSVLSAAEDRTPFLLRTSTIAGSYVLSYVRRGADESKVVHALVQREGGEEAGGWVLAPVREAGSRASQRHESLVELCAVHSDWLTYPVWADVDEGDGGVSILTLLKGITLELASTLGGFAPSRLAPGSEPGSAATRIAATGNEYRAPLLLPLHCFRAQADQLLRAVGRSSFLTALSLNGDPGLLATRPRSACLGDEQAMLLGTVLADGGAPSLRVLNLSCNSITSEGAAALAVGLRAAKALISFDIARNEIASRGIRQLALVLTGSNLRLARYDVGAQRVTSTGLRRIDSFMGVLRVDTTSSASTMSAASSSASAANSAAEQVEGEAEFWQATVDDVLARRAELLGTSHVTLRGAMRLSAQLQRTASRLETVRAVLRRLIPDAPSNALVHGFLSHAEAASLLDSTPGTYACYLHPDVPDSVCVAAVKAGGQSFVRYRLQRNARGYSTTSSHVPSLKRSIAWMLWAEHTRAVLVAASAILGLTGRPWLRWPAPVVDIVAAYALASDVTELLGSSPMARGVADRVAPEMRVLVESIPFYSELWRLQLDPASVGDDFFASASMDHSPATIEAVTASLPTLTALRRPTVHAEDAIADPEPGTRKVLAKRPKNVNVT
eukprot:CAMPEP_0170732474 /NCGR_PEP_ID=MMETSP0437-20130122/1574_1 /TAXON_ID=0 /ORGANISM="Sexangularia sp." /LENGTH=659 /DNA_ID=CAMNT_0011070719 /DNA_START=229 /DNA_END=2205 /DNA_ORIENTATION=-